MLGPNTRVLVVGGDAAYVGRQATVESALKLTIGGTHVLGWLLKEGWRSSKTGKEILWAEKNLMPLEGYVKTEQSSTSLNKPAIV